MMNEDDIRDYRKVDVGAVVWVCEVCVDFRWKLW